MLVDVSDIETKIFKLKDAQAFGRDIFNFMPGSGSQVFITTKILQMNRICDKLTKMHIAQLASSKQSDIRSFFYFQLVVEKNVCFSTCKKVQL